MKISWILLIGILLAGCSEQETKSSKQTVSPPSSVVSNDAKLGKSLFASNCKSCHGSEAGGTQSGPPLIHKIYEPSHHSDFSFYKAVTSGVKNHHWGFGDMPPVPGVSPQQIGHIIAYIRQKQRKAGIR